MPADIVNVGRALISVSDKAGLVDLGRALAARGVEILSTGGTAAALGEAGLAVVDVAQTTGFPEMMDGRVKTLHPRIHGGLLAVRADPSHQAAMLANDIAPIDLLIVNLYPFEATLGRNASFDDRIETIDVGGPAMVRGAAKNHEDVAVIVDVADYSGLIAELERHDGGTSLAFRRRMAQKAFARTAAYDAAISNWLAAEIGEAPPKWRAVGGTLHESFGTLRYGENPHQGAALYLTAETRPGVATARQLQGKELSYNNINDADAAYELVAEFDPATSAAVAIVKHANPCGVAVGGSLQDAYERALACDPVSAFGGVIGVNRPVDGEAAEEMHKLFLEVIAAPAFDQAAIARFASKKNLRLVEVHDPWSLGRPVRGADESSATPRSWVLKNVSGGMLVQETDSRPLQDADLKVVTKRAPTPEETRALLFAWKVCKHVKSNAIVYARDGQTVGVGAGQMSRVDAARIGAMKAQLPLKGTVAASDAFFPFPDGVEEIAKAGATAIIQPGGSQRDAEVIDAADRLGLAMLFTGVRHFRH